jgi:hypothetical protein
VVKPTKGEDLDARYKFTKRIHLFGETQTGFDHRCSGRTHAEVEHMEDIEAQGGRRSGDQPVIESVSSHTIPLEKAIA